MPDTSQPPVPLTHRPRFEDEVVRQYSARLLAMAASALPGQMRGRMDPEDVLQSVYLSFFRRFGEGSFHCEDSADVWQLLAAMTYHKARSAVRFHRQQRRDVRQESGEPIPEQRDPAAPGPEDVRLLFDSLESVLLRVAPHYRDIVLARMEGAEVGEIASRIGRSERTVLRALARLKELIGTEMKS